MLGMNIRRYASAAEKRQSPYIRWSGRKTAQPAAGLADARECGTCLDIQDTKNTVWSTGTRHGGGDRRLVFAAPGTLSPSRNCLQQSIERGHPRDFTPVHPHEAALPDSPG